MTGLALWTVAAHALLKIDTMAGAIVFLLLYYSRATDLNGAEKVLNVHFMCVHFLYLFMCVFINFIYLIHQMQIGGKHQYMLINQYFKYLNYDIKNFASSTDLKFIFIRKVLFMLILKLCISFWN